MFGKKNRIKIEMMKAECESQLNACLAEQKRLRREKFIAQTIDAYKQGRLDILEEQEKHLRNLLGILR